MSQRPATSALAEFLAKKGVRSGIVALTGAGCSTESGIPDYRGPHGRYRQEDFVPLTYQVFTSTDAEKRRYWARSMLGYSRMRNASCNDTHMGLLTLSRAGVVSRVLTQNVDGLHHLATHGGQWSGDPEMYFRSAPDTTTRSSNSSSSDSGDSAQGHSAQHPYHLTEIHGNIHLVVCMRCKHVMPRATLQDELRRLNPDIYDRFAGDSHLVRPDGDFSAPREAVEAMRLVMCPACGGHLKPHVVLFGENVPKAVAADTVSAVKQSSCLLCLGTSLQVYSAYRYVLAAKEAGVPVVIANHGKTRADDLADLKIDTQSIASLMRETTLDLCGPSALS